MNAVDSADLSQCWTRAVSRILHVSLTKSPISKGRDCSVHNVLKHNICRILEREMTKEPQSQLEAERATF